MMSDTKKILIVEDDPATLSLLKQYLSLHDYDVHGEMTGVGGMRQAERFEPDLLILDLMLPDMDGYVVCKLLRSRPKTKDLPILILSALTAPENVRRGYEVGATDYLKKPFDLEKLLKAVTTTMNKQPVEDAAAPTKKDDDKDDDIDFVVSPDQSG